ncbi:hypothetical protein M9Y10_004106 [Tritrichomonas musculus]|uniref:Uncharacterized protein n=1 Tax=Tritrichomonas musculus TaxID=1915356 RepID=A0ABR2JR32_9EUKA
MDFQDFVNQKNEIYSKVIMFFDCDDTETETSYQELIDIIQLSKLHEKKNDLREFLCLLMQIESNHHRDTEFFSKIEKIFQFFFNYIKPNFSNNEIFSLFQHNKRILIYLLDKNVISIDNSTSPYIYDNNPGIQYLYFTPELKSFLDEENQKLIEKDFLKLDENAITNFDTLRKTGENESFICQLIRNDSIDDFIEYVNRQNYLLSSTIEPSIFETNSFLLKKKTTLIEYAVFYGSFQIFQFLRMNDVKLTSSLWLYAIHGRNPEIIHLLEEFHVEVKNGYAELYEESIKCHHNELANYFDTNYDFRKSNEISFKYYNYSLFPDDFNDINIFAYLCKYNYISFIEILLQTLEMNFDEKVRINKASQSLLQIAANENNYEILNLLMNKIKFVCFEYCSKLTQITIPSTVTTIVEKAFNQCISLKQLIIPSSVTSIKYGAFNNCESLEQLIIPSSVVSIEGYAFHKCFLLKKIELPPSLKKIEDSTFGECKSLQEIIIPSSVVSIGKYAFSECTSLVKIEIPSSVTSIDVGAFRYCKSLSQVTFVNPCSLTLLNEHAFENCYSLQNFEIPQSLTTIKNCTFSGCHSFTKIDIPSTITSIEYGAFCNCTHLTHVNIPSSITSIDDRVFNGCNSLQHVKIPSSVTSIRQFAFKNCGALKEIFIPSSVTSIRDGAFSDCHELIKINIPSSVTSIEGNLFCRCASLKELSIPSSVTSIGYRSFYSCVGLQNIIIPSSVTSIGEHAFDNCISLKQISIPSSVTSIGEYSFECCSSLKQVELLANVTKIEKNVFSNCSALVQIEIPPSVISIEENAFYKCRSLKTIIIPPSVQTIHESAFLFCNKLQEQIPNGFPQNRNVNNDESFCIIA